MAGHEEARRHEERFACRLKIYFPEDQTKCIGENTRPFAVDLGCWVRHAAPNWGNQRWKDIPANEKDALFMKLEVDYSPYKFLFLCYFFLY